MPKISQKLDKKLQKSIAVDGEQNAERDLAEVLLENRWKARQATPETPRVRIHVGWSIQDLPAQRSTQPAVLSQHVGYVK